MQNAKQTIVIAVLICAGLGNVCSPAFGVQRRIPTVRELLDIYRERMDKIKSYTCETETFYTGKVITLCGGTKIPNEGIAPSTVEMRADGERFYICERDPTGLGMSKRVFIPNDRGSRTWLWDGKYYYFYGQHTRQYAHKYAEKYTDEQRREQYIKTATGSVAIYVNIEDPDTERMITKRRPNLPGYSQAYYLLSRAKKVKISNKTETINGSKCYVVGTEMGLLKSKLWIDPAHGYLIAKRIDRTSDGKYFEILDVTFKRFDGIWFVAQEDFQYFNSGGRWSEDRSRYRLTKFVLNPDHDELKSFETDFVEGADVRLFGAEEISQRQHFTWQDGKVMDAEGKQINLHNVRPLAELRGKPLPQLGEIGILPEKGQIENRPILVCFWDMQQRPSRNCLRQLSARAQGLEAQDVIVLAVQASKVDENTLHAWVKKNSVPFPVGMTQGDETKTRFDWGVKSLPWLILTDKEHIVRADGFALAELDEKIQSAEDSRQR